MMTKYKPQSLRVLAALAALAAVTGCGGGGGGGTSTNGPSAEGAYSGTLSGSVSNAFELLVLNDGTYWSLYGTRSNNVLYVAGFVQGSGSSNNGSFSSSNMRDFGFAPALGGTLSATYTSSAISGTVSESGATVTFSGTTADVAPYVYNTPALLSDVAGSWNLALLDGETASVNVSSTGTVGGVSSGGCQFSGTLAPHTSGKNVFSLTLNFGASPCVLAGQSATGIAVYTPTNTGLHQLLVAAVDSTRTYGTAAFGSR